MRTESLWGLYAPSGFSQAALVQWLRAGSPRLKLRLWARKLGDPGRFARASAPQSPHLHRDVNSQRAGWGGVTHVKVLEQCVSKTCLTPSVAPLHWIRSTSTVTRDGDPHHSQLSNRCLTHDHTRGPGPHASPRPG